MSLLTFHNNFDDVTVAIDDESPVVDGQITHNGPFVVTMTHGSESLEPGKVTSERFTQLSDARAHYLALVANEFDSVL